MIENLIDNQIFSQGTSLDKTQEAIRIVLEIIENLDEAALKQLLGGTENDIDTLLRTMVSETYSALYGKVEGVQTSSNLGVFDPSGVFYLDKLNNTVEETLRIESLTYFLTSVMPDFEMNWHHIEWSEMIQTYNQLCVLAARGHGKCLHPDTPIRMFDGSIKKAKEIKVGDKLMGIDSTPRIALRVGTGQDNLFKIKQSRGDDYIVNSRHTLTLLNGGHAKYNSIIDIDLTDVQKLSNNRIYEDLRGFKVAIDYPTKKVEVEPYYLGIWLGDGNAHDTGITSMDIEVETYLFDYAKRLDMDCSKGKTKSKACLYKIIRRNGTAHDNKLTSLLKNLEVINNKHIPKKYLINDKETRLQLLAGLVDSDGNLSYGSYHISTIYKHLAEEIKDLADSLGFRTYLGGGVKFSKQLQRDYESYFVTISGTIEDIPVKIKRKKKKVVKNKTSYKKPRKVDNIQPSVISDIKIEPAGCGEYVSITINGDKRFLLGDGTVTHNSYMYSNAYPCWRLYRYNKFSKRKELSVLGKEGYMFSFSKTQAVKLLRTVKETISSNDILRDKLKPGSDGWAETKIELKNGTRIIVESAGASTRGAHPGWIVVDDFLKDNVLYSKDQRDKYTNYFYSVIKPMLEPGGQIIVVGTPFHSQDLYGDLKFDATGSRRKGWHVREYPAIFPNGKILWSNRFTLDYLLQEKLTLGTTNFSREYLVRPITNDSSIFPFNILEKSLIGMKNYKMVNNIESFPVKLKRVAIGVDLAISANVGADYTVYSVLGLDEEDCIWVLRVVRLHGKSYQEQIAHLKKLHVDFRPDVIQIESNGFQAMFSQAADSEGLPVISDATTSKSKNDLKTGLPGIALLFERSKIKIPIGDQESRDMKDLIFSEFSSITFTNNGLQATGGHDDIPMSIHQGVKGLDYRNTGFGVTFAG